MNKQLFFGLLAVVMIAAVAAFNVSLNSQEETLSDLAMENVEALAIELPEVVIECGLNSGQCWDVDEFPYYPWEKITCRWVGNMRYYCST